MHLRKIFLFLLLIGHCCITTNAQPPSARVTPPSPRSQEFTKYTNFTVSLYNGLPEISVPLYNIKIDGLEIPVNLSYHASGIKFGEHLEPGEVGLGWTMNPGYRVSRTTNGLADDQYPMPADLLTQYYAVSGAGSDLDNFLKYYIENNTNRPNALWYELKDGEYDFFNYNLASASGSFLIADRVNKKVQTMEIANVKVAYTTGNNSQYNVNGINGLQLTDDAGINYYAGEALPAAGNYVYETNSGTPGVASAWAVTDIINPIGQKVHFSYTGGSGGKFRYDQRSFTFMDAVGCSDAGDNVASEYFESEGVYNSYQTFFLYEITSESERVRFTRNGTKQVLKIEVFDTANVKIKTVDFYYSNGSTILDSVKLLDRSNNGVETYSFEYYPGNLTTTGNVADQWGYPVENNPNNIYHQEFANDEVRTSTGGSSPIAYHILQNYTSNFSTRNERFDIPNDYVLKKITYPTGGTTEYQYENNMFMGNGAIIKHGGGIRVASIVSQDKVNGTLRRRYKYGTNENSYGVYCNFYDFNYANFVSEGIQFRALGPSQRPQRVVTYSSSPQGDFMPPSFNGSYVVYPEVTEYFEDDTASTRNGKIVYQYWPRNQFTAQTLSPGLSLGMCPANLQYFGSSPFYVTRYSIWDKPVLTEKHIYKWENAQYKKVQRETYSYSYDTRLFEGLKVREFATAWNYTPLDNIHYYSYINSFFRSGPYTIECGISRLYEQKTIVYSLNDSLVTRKQYDYNSKNQVSRETTINSKGEESISWMRYPQDVFTSGTPGFPDPQFNWVSTLVDGNRIRMPLETIKGIKKTGVEYVTDGSLTTYKGTLVNFPSGSYYLPLLYKEHLLEITAPILKSNYINFKVGFSVAKETYTMDTRMKSRLTYHSYDGAGNATLISNDGDLYYSYLWNYRKKYPVAEVKNPTPGTIAYSSFETNDDQGGWTRAANSVFLMNNTITGKRTLSGCVSITVPQGNYTVTVWAEGNVSVNGQPVTASELVSKRSSSWYLRRIALTNVTQIQVCADNMDELRLYPTGAEMTTYTYEPLVGVTSECNKANVITYYQYDAYDRLQVIRDDGYNVIKLFDYKFQAPANGQD